MGGVQCCPECPSAQKRSAHYGTCIYEHGEVIEVMGEQRQPGAYTRMSTPRTCCWVTPETEVVAGSGIVIVIEPRLVEVKS